MSSTTSNTHSIERPWWSLLGAWRTLGDDPIGILLPVAAILLLDLMGVLIVRQGVTSLSWMQLAGLWWGIQAARVVLATPFRALEIGAAARAMNRDDIARRALARSPALLIVHLLTIAASGLAAAAVVGPCALAAGVLASQGWYATGSLFVALAGVGGAGMVLAVRVALAYAPIEVVAGGLGPFAAVSTGFRRHDHLSVTAILLFGDFAVALGALLCGAGALPGYPLADLALLRRWSLAPPRDTP